MNMKEFSSIAYKRHRIAVYLDDLLAKLPPGGKLPGMRELIRDSGVGRTLLERELRELVARGRAEVKPRQGYFVRQGAGTERVLLLHEALYPSHEGGFVDQLFDHMARLAGERGLSLRFVKVAAMHEAELAELLTRSRAEQVFLNGLRDAPRAEFVRGRVRYCVEILPRHASSLGAEVRNSPISAMQMEYLFQRGYTRIAYMHQVQDWNNTPTQLIRLLNYYRVMSEKNLPVRPEWVFQYVYDWENLNRDMYKMMNSPEPPEALIAPGSSMEFVYRFCANNGIAVGSELAVLGCDDTAPGLSPRPTTVTNYPVEIARQAWSIMDSLCRGEVRKELTTPLIVTGETVPVRKRQ